MRSDSGGTGPFRRIVVGVDGSEASHCALVWRRGSPLPREPRSSRYTQWIPRRSSAEVPRRRAKSCPKALRPLGRNGDPTWSALLEEDWCTPLRQAGVPFTGKTVEGGPRALLGVANHEHADAIIVGRRGRGGLAELVLGSFSHHVVHHSSRPVIVVPKESE